MPRCSANFFLSSAATPLPKDQRVSCPVLAGILKKDIKISLQQKKSTSNMVMHVSVITVILHALILSCCILRLVNKLTTVYGQASTNTQVQWIVSAPTRNRQAQVVLAFIFLSFFSHGYTYAMYGHLFLNTLNVPIGTWTMQQKLWIPIFNTWWENETIIFKWCKNYIDVSQNLLWNFQPETLPPTMHHHWNSNIFIYKHMWILKKRSRKNM